MTPSESVRLKHATSNTIVDRICRNWSTKSAVRTGEFTEVPEPFFEKEKRDFPSRLIPFSSHPLYRELGEPVHRQVEALAWVSWNKRVVDTEELVVSPALVALMSGSTDIALKGTSRMAIRQTLVDEYFHSHMHDIAVGLTLRGRGIPEGVADRLNRPACVYRSYLETAEDMEHNWEKDLARLAWCVVGELSIYEFLTIVSSDETIQPASRTLLRLHERDEASHASLIAQVMRAHFHELSDEQKECFSRCIPKAIRGFSQEDWLVWKDILDVAEVDSATKIIEDTKQNRDVPDSLPLTRSFLRISDFCRDVGIDLEAHESSERILEKLI